MRYSWYEVKGNFGRTRCKKNLKHTVPSVEPIKLAQNFKVAPSFVSGVHRRPQARFFFRLMCSCVTHQEFDTSGTVVLLAYMLDKLLSMKCVFVL